MSKKILVVPDIHGRTFWKEPVQKYMDQVDRVIFLGDYLDPYPKEGIDCNPQTLFDNLMGIIDLKIENNDKVVLLKGNHDEQYASEKFRVLACSNRCDTLNWDVYNEVFVRFKSLFKLCHLEYVNETPYLFSHAGVTLFWLHKVNTKLWKLADNRVSVTDSDIIDRINLLDTSDAGQRMLSMVGKLRSMTGEKTGSILWADIEEHNLNKAPEAYGLNKVFQVFGHTRLNPEYDKLEFDHLAMIDGQRCFMIDENRVEKILSI